MSQNRQMKPKQPKSCGPQPSTKQNQVGVFISEECFLHTSHNPVRAVSATLFSKLTESLGMLPGMCGLVLQHEDSVKFVWSDILT